MRERDRTGSAELALIGVLTVLFCTALGAAFVAAMNVCTG